MYILLYEEGGGRERERGWEGQDHTHTLKYFTNGWSLSELKHVSVQNTYA